MKIHSIFSLAVNEIWARDVSCYCLNCFDKTFQLLSLCEGWNGHCLSREAVSRATKLKALPAAQLQSQPDGRETEMLMLNCQSIFKKKTLLPLFIQRIEKFTSVKF